MKKSVFVALCAEHCIAPGVAIENARVVRALTELCSFGELDKILSEEF